MSRQNLEIVKRGWDHFLATSELLEEVVTAEFVWDMSRFQGWPEKPYYEGSEGVPAFLRDWSEPFDELNYEVETYHDAGDSVVAVLRQRGRVRASGATVEMRYTVVSTVRDGLQTRATAYGDPAYALKAVGLTK